MCDEVTGRCPCNPGVGGDECSICLDGFYGFSPQGCTGCYEIYSIQNINILDFLAIILLVQGTVKPFLLYVINL